MLDVMAGQHVEALSGRTEGAGIQRDLGGETEGEWLSGAPGRGSQEAPAVVFVLLRPALSQQVSWLAEPQGCVRQERASRVSSGREPGAMVRGRKGQWVVLEDGVPGSLWEPQLQSCGLYCSGPPWTPASWTLL